MAHRSPDLRYCRLSRSLALASARPRLLRLSLALAFRAEGGQFRSGTAREIVRRRLGVVVGAYSYGACFEPGLFQRNTVVGRYVSVGPGVRTYVRNHPHQTLSTHPFFFNSGLGLVAEDTVPFGRLEIGHDAWIGCNVVVTPGCRRIGVGAVIAAGTIVTRNVPDFAVVGGAPAELLCYRFSKELKQAILASRWWERPPEQLRPSLPWLTSPLPSHPSVYGPLLRSIGPPHT